MLRDRNLITLSDTVLAAERADAVEMFARFGFCGMPKKGRAVDESVPIEVDIVNKMRAGRSSGASGQCGGYSAQRVGKNVASVRGEQVVRSGRDECFYCKK